MNKKRGFWFLLSGLLLGLAVGLLITWVITPNRYTNTSPDSLRIDFKDQYRFMVAAAYQANHDILRARARIAVLGDPDPAKALGEQAQRMLANKAPMNQIQILANLSIDLQTIPTEVPSPTIELTLSPTMLPSVTATTSFTITSTKPTVIPSSTNQPEITHTSLPLASITSSATPQPVFTKTTTSTLPPLASFTPVASPTLISTPTFPSEPSSTPLISPTATHILTKTPTPTPAMTFKLIDQSAFCDPDNPGLLEVNFTDSKGNPIPGIEIILTWVAGEEHIFTGLKPEISDGYADFKMSQNTEYVLTLLDGNIRISGLTPEQCTNLQGDAFLKGIRLEFKQP